jgi:lipopolysaccharide export system protein LptC
VTYWPLTEGQTANDEQANPSRVPSRRSTTVQPGEANSGQANSGQARSGSSGLDPGPVDPALSLQPQKAGRHPGEPRENEPRQPTVTDPSGIVPAVAARTGGYLAIVSRRGARLVPTHSRMLRRRLMITASKFVLPAVAVLLLSSIALWPEFRIESDRTRVSMGGVSVTMDGARLTDAHYNGVDERGRPYTVTAATAIQRNGDRVDLTIPNGDITLENGTWLNMRSKQGVYMRKDQQLDLSRDVMLYRDDGTTMATESATVAMKDGAASSGMPTHVEGPFGTLDATGFTTVEKGAAIQFWGPVRVELNGVSK